MSRSWPIFGHLTAGFSVMFFCYHGVCQLISKPEHQNLAIKFTVITGMLCVGTAIAIQLGRVIEQPIHVLGPSDERFQTVVSVYWITITSLILLTSTKLSPELRTSLSIFILAFIVLLASPADDYLKEEIKSVEQAALLFTRAEVDPSLTKKEKKLINFKQERVLLQDEFYARHELSYRAPSTEDGFEVTTNCYLSPNLESSVASLSEAKSLLIRSLYVERSHTQNLRLTPVHTGDYYPHQLLIPSLWKWERPPYQTTEKIRLLAEVALPFEQNCETGY